MKKLLMIVVVLFVAQFGFSQHTEGDKNLNVGLTLNAFAGSTIPINASFDYGIADQFSAGLYTYVFIDSAGTGATAGVRGLFHPNFDVENLDAYGGLALGYGLTGGGFDYALLVGTRYFFSENIGVYAEGGFLRATAFNAGVTFKF